MKYGMIPFFIPHVGCPHVCTFCNQSRITETEGIGYLTPSYITKTIEDYTGYDRNRIETIDTAKAEDLRENQKKNKFWEVCFYGGSFSAVPKDLQIQLLEPAHEALQRGMIDGIRCSTRPDAVSDGALSLLQSYGVSTVELGVQSMNDRVLNLAKRGHTSDDVRAGVQQLRKFNMTIGLQILPGLLGDSWQTILETAVEIVKLQPDFVRIYPVLVIENTELADQYRMGHYTPLSTELAIQYSAFLKTWFENHHITVIRTGLQSTEELDKGSSLLAGPYEPAMGELVANYQWLQRIILCIEHHIDAFYESLYRRNSMGHIVIEYPRNLTSKVRGLKNRNLQHCHETYENTTFTWAENNSINHPICCIDGVKYML